MSCGREAPNLPSYRSNQFTQRHKLQTLTYKNDYAVLQETGYRTRKHLARSLSESTLLKSGPGSTTSLPPIGPKSGAAALPDAKFITHDKCALRFYGYFKEAVHENALENFRVRKLTIYYYMEDDTISINEPKVENSGIPQGNFVKRHQLPKEGGAPGDSYTLADLYYGAELNIYSRVVRIVDADDFTKAKYSEFAGSDLLGAPEEYPEDKYTRNRETIMERETGGDSTVSYATKVTDMKRFLEAQLGKSENLNLGRFLENDGKVLRFYAEWDDRNSLYGDKNKFVIHYFLADNTVEVREKHQANNGKDNFPIFHKRNRMPKNYRNTTSLGINSVPDSKFYSASDFDLGITIDFYGRNFRFVDADASTKDYYIRVHNRELVPVETEPDKKVRKTGNY